MAAYLPTGGVLMNNYEDIFKLLNLPNDGSINIDKVITDDKTKTIHLSRNPIPTYCDVCGARMYSKGIYKRNVNHQILQDSTHLNLIIHQRKWKCTNCSCYKNELFPFVEKHKQSTTLIPLLVLDAMKDLNRSAVSIAKQFNISDTQVHDIFTAYVDLPRLKLPEILSVDEVYLNINHKDKYALVLMDFKTGEIVDILHNRWKSTVDQYFYSIPLEERKRVKFIICDAYRNYMEYPENYFPNAKVILDSFHISKHLISKLNAYINQVMKRYLERDKKELEKKNHDTNRDNKSIKESDEVILLRNYRWVLLKNNDEIKYSVNRHYHNLLGMHLDTYTIEKMFFALDVNFKPLHELKERFIIFNQSKFDKYEDVEKDFDELINEYKASDQIIFKQFAEYLNKFKTEIIYSFTVSEVSRRTKDEQDKYYSRLSNGPMEGFNRKPKDYKRNARGFSNFDYTRNRILWSTRKNPTVRGIPKSYQLVHSYKTDHPRGPYMNK